MTQLFALDNGVLREFGEEDYLEYEAQRARDAALLVAKQEQELAEYMQEFRSMRTDLLNVLGGIAMAEDAIPAFKVMRRALLDIPAAPDVVKATTAEEAKRAVKAEYAKIVPTAPPAFVKAFKEQEA